MACLDAHLYEIEYKYLHQTIIVYWIILAVFKLLFVNFIYVIMLS
jgi:hypothetical protein